MTFHQMRPATAAQAPPVATGQVVRSDSSGVWVTPLLGDTRHPVGPCRGGRRPNADLTGWEQIPAGTVVLLVLTDAGPWVAAHDQPTT